MVTNGKCVDKFGSESKKKAASRKKTTGTNKPA
jgi:hypothetical protein